MRIARSLPPVRLVTPLALVAVFAATPVSAKDCPRDGVPPGVRMPDQVGCKTPPPDAAKKRPAVRAGRQPGFMDLGNGTELRISGEADVEFRYRR